MGQRYAELASDHHLLFPLHIAAADMLAELAGPTPARVVDAGCDCGEYVAALARRGYEAFGVDVDRRFHAAAVARHEALAGHFIHGDLLEVFDLVRGPLHLACCIDGALGELGNDAEVADVLGQLLDLAKPAGRVVLDVPNFDHLTREAQRALAVEAPDPGGVRYVELENSVHGHDSPQIARIEGDSMLLQLAPISAYREDGAELRLERAWVWPPTDGLLSMEWSFTAPEGSLQGGFSVLALTRERLEALLPGPARWFGDYAGRPWSVAAPYTIAVLDAA